MLLVECKRIRLCDMQVVTNVIRCVRMFESYTVERGERIARQDSGGFDEDQIEVIKEQSVDQKNHDLVWIFRTKTVSPKTTFPIFSNILRAPNDCSGTSVADHSSRYLFLSRPLTQLKLSAGMIEVWHALYKM